MLKTHSVKEFSIHWRGRASETKWKDGYKISKLQLRVSCEIAIFRLKIESLKQNGKMATKF